MKGSARGKISGETVRVPSLSGGGKWVLAYATAPVSSLGTLHLVRELKQREAFLPMNSLVGLC